MGGVPCRRCGEHPAAFSEFLCARCLMADAKERSSRIPKPEACAGCGKDDRMLYGGYCDRCHPPR